MGKGKKLTPKQKAFVDEYIKTGNATQAIMNAGYKTKNPRTAAAMGARLLAVPVVQAALEKRLSKMDRSRIASADEVMEYLTSVMRGESNGSELVVEGNGPGLSLAREVFKKPSEQDRLKAANLLAKRFNLHMTTEEFKARLKRLQLENEKLQAEIDRMKGGADEEIDDGFIEALSSTAAEDWADE